jgi:hypothetical protein
MIDQISAGGAGASGIPQLQANLRKAQAVSAEKVPILPANAPDVQLSPSAQARLLRREGKSIPQIAIRLGLSIPTVDAFFKE